MDYLQYEKTIKVTFTESDDSFKPYYRWITFNTARLKGLAISYGLKF